MLVGEYTIEGYLIKDLKPRSERKVKLICDDCGKETITTYANYNTYTKKINFNGETRCNRCSSKISGRKNKGRISKTRGIPQPNRRGKNSPTWKGGEYVASDGYKMVRVNSGTLNRKSGWNQYQKEHVYLIEKELNRKLTKNEIVHHIDGNKLNNSLNNLWLCDHSKHRTAHQSLQEIGYLLIKNKLIHFNTTTGQYEADIKLCELLEQPEEVNQQPSLESDLLEGSTTSENVLFENMNHHERRASLVKIEKVFPNYKLFGPFSGIDVRSYLIDDDIV